MLMEGDNVANYPYRIFGCSCNSQCVCMLCGKIAEECVYAGCEQCDKMTGHRGCQNRPDRIEREELRWQNIAKGQL